MPVPNPPPRWGSDDLTEYIDSARHNAFATFSNIPAAYQKLSGIEGVFRKLATNLDRSPNWFAGLFLLRAHATWLASVNLALSCKVLETYVLLRVCLETALYGHLISVDPALAETWLRRGESEANKRAAISAFTFRKMIDALAKNDKNEARVAEVLYEQCIADGAHPNERGFMGNLRIEDLQDGKRFNVQYQNADPIALGLALKTTARVGVCSLGIFRQMFRERFDLLGLSEALQSLRNNL